MRKKLAEKLEAKALIQNICSSNSSILGIRQQQKNEKTRREGT